MAIIWTHRAHYFNGLIWRSFLNPQPDRNITGSPTRRWAQMVQARHNTWKYKLNENETISFTNRVQTYEINLQNFTIDGLKFEIKRSYIYSNYHQFWSFSTGRTGSPNRSDRFTQPVGPVGTILLPPPVRPVPRAGQTGLRKTERLNTLPSSVQPDNPLT